MVQSTMTGWVPLTVDPDAGTGAIVEYTDINPGAAFVPDRWGMNFDNVAKSPTFDIVVALVTATIKYFYCNN